MFQDTVVFFQYPKAILEQLYHLRIPRPYPLKFPVDIERKQQYLETLGVNDRLMMLLQDMAKEKKMSEVYES